VQGSDGSFLKHLPIYPCIIEPLPFKLKQMRNMLAELIQSNQWSSSETFNGVHVKFVKQFQIAHALLEHKQYIYEINVKPLKYGSIVKQHPINACIIEALPIKLKKCETFLPN
jgi:hypothetical protein